jgi:hypothetical protein
LIATDEVWRAIPGHTTGPANRVAQTGTAPFSGGASTPALKGNKGKKNSSNPGKRQQRPKAAWGNCPTSASPGSFAGAGFQAQTPPTFLGSDREAEYVAEIQQLRTLLATPNHANAFLMQQHAYATQSVSSAPRPRSHYCGLHGWNNDHNGTECRGMARDSRYTDTMRAATTHVDTGGNPKVGVPVGYTRPPPHTLFPPASPEHCPVSHPNPLASPKHCPVSLPYLSQDSSAKLAQNPYEDNSARASPASTRNMSEGHNASLVRELAGALSVLPVPPALHVCPAQTVCSVSSLLVLSLLSRKTRPKTRQLTPLTDTPNSKPRIVTPNRVTWSVSLVSLSVAPSFPLARLSPVNASLQHRSAFAVTLTQNCHCLLASLTITPSLP